MVQRKQFPGERNAFTLVELLVVIGIIAVLIGILIPVVSKVRLSARTADTQAFISQLANAINNYYNDHRAYPGPFSNVQVWNTDNVVPGPSFTAFQVAVPSSVAPNAFVTVGGNIETQVTMSENLVLGLLGGLRVQGTGPFTLVYDPSLVGTGPNSLSTVPGAGKRHNPYVEQASLSWRDTSDGRTGKFEDDVVAANDPKAAADTIIPEFVDRFYDPMPILYLRARVGARSGAVTPLANDNTIITFDSGNPSNRVGQYDLHQIAAYTKSIIGVGRKQIEVVGHTGTPPVHGLSTVDVDASIDRSAASPLTYYYPYDAYAYFRNKSLSGPQSATNRNDVPHQKDGFILISAGVDRIYGTEDDITNFGAIGK